MKGTFGILSLAALLFFAACDSGSGSGSGSGSSPKASQFDVSARSLLSGTGTAAKMVSGWEVATNTDSIQVIVNTAFEIWLDSNASNYSTYFNADGSIKNDSSGSAYKFFWGSYKASAATTDLSDGVSAASAGKVWIDDSETDKPSRMAITFGNASDTFMDSEGVVVVLRVFPSATSGTIDLATTGESKEWKITVTKDTATRTTEANALASLSIAAKFGRASTGGTIADSAITTSIAAKAVDASAKTLALKAVDSSFVDTDVIALKDFTPTGNAAFTAKTIFFSHIEGNGATATASTVQTTAVKTAVATEIAYDSGARVNGVLTTLAGVKPNFVLTISDKYGEVAKVTAEVTATVS